MGAIHSLPQSKHDLWYENIYKDIVEEPLDLLARINYLGQGFIIGSNLRNFLLNFLGIKQLIGNRSICLTLNRVVIGVMSS